MRFGLKWVWAIAALLVLSTSQSYAANDIGAEQSAALYDLLSPIAITRPPPGADEGLYQQAVEILKQENLLPGSSRPMVKESGRLQALGKALGLPGERAVKFSSVLADIDNLLTRGGESDLRSAVSNLWATIGRTRPEGSAMDPIIEALRKVDGGSPMETINHTIDKPNYRIEITHAREGEQVQVVVSHKNDKGEIIDRTVFQGHRDTLVNDKGDDLVRRARLDRVCTNDAKSDALVKDTLHGEWSPPGSTSKWVITGSADNLTVTDDRAGE